MVQYSHEILNLFGAPELSELVICSAKELPVLPDYLSTAMWNYIGGTLYRDTSLHHLELALLRRTNAAFEEYNIARNHLLRYIDGVKDGKHLLTSYLSALTHFEQCLSSFWQAAELFDRIGHKLLRSDQVKLTLYRKGDNSDLERINELTNVSKHFSAMQAEQTSTPIWITNAGLKCANTTLSFDELYENLMALSEIVRQTFVEIPKEALTKSTNQ